MRAYNLRSMFAIGLLLMSLSGCRLPKLFITPPENKLFYDTAYEQELLGQPQPEPDSLEYDFRWRYRDTLAEPVTLISYSQDEHSAWEILFATNREPQNEPDNSTISYQNDYSQNLYYGHCAVGLTVPTKEELEREKPDGVWGKVVEVLPKPWQEEVIFDESKYTSVKNVTQLTSSNFYQRLNQLIINSRQKDVLIFVHGFNVEFEASVGRLAQIARDMPFNGAVIAYSWPSQGGVDNYKEDGKVVNESIPPFKQFLNDLKANLPAEAKINIVVHSMGNRLAMRAISQLRNADEDAPKQFENIVLCAPDVGVDEFERIGPAVIDSAKHTTLYRCLNDSALIASAYRNKEERAGGSYAPVILDGMDTVECSVIDTSILGHSYYGSNPHMLRDLFCILKESQTASDRPWLKKQKIPFQGDMWIIADWPVQLEWKWNLPSQGRNQILHAGFEKASKKDPPPYDHQAGKILLPN